MRRETKWHEEKTNKKKQPQQPQQQKACNHRGAEPYDDVVTKRYVRQVFVEDGRREQVGGVADVPAGLCAY